MASTETVTMGLEDKKASGTPDSLMLGPGLMIAQLWTLPSDPPSLPTGNRTGLVIPPVDCILRAVSDSTPEDAACPLGHGYRTVTVTLKEARPAALFVTNNPISYPLYSWTNEGKAHTLVCSGSLDLRCNVHVLSPCQQLGSFLGAANTASVTSG